MTPKQGDIVLIPVPFTDLSSQKRRPVVVISSDGYNKRSLDVVTVAMTSNPSITPFGFQIDSRDLVEGVLNRPGTIRADKIFTLSQTIIVKKFGRVSPAIVTRIRSFLEELTKQ